MQTQEALGSVQQLERASARGRVLLNLRCAEVEGGLLGRTLLTLVSNKVHSFMLATVTLMVFMLHWWLSLPHIASELPPKRAHICSLRDLSALKPKILTPIWTQNTKIGGKVL